MKSPCLSTETEGVRIIWGVKGKCNLKCKFCAADFENKDIEHPMSRYADVLKDMKESGIDTIYLSGGEPLLWEGIFDVIKFGKGYEIKMTLGTNGTILNEEKAKKLNESEIDKVFVSLDHYKKEKHDFLRGSGVFEQAVKGVKLLKDYEIYTRIDSIVWRENYQSLKEFVDFCEKLRVDEIAFAWPMKVGRATKNPEILPPEEKYFDIGKKLKELKENSNVKISYHRFEYLDKNCKNCSGGEKILYINPSGEISPCFWVGVLFPEFFTEKTVFGNNFSDLLEEEPVKKFIEMKEERYKQFGPGCPAVCSIEKKIYSKDPLLKIVTNMKNKEKF